MVRDANSHAGIPAGVLGRRGYASANYYRSSKNRLGGLDPAADAHAAARAADLVLVVCRRGKALAAGRSMMLQYGPEVRGSSASNSTDVSG